MVYHSDRINYWEWWGRININRPRSAGARQDGEVEVSCCARGAQLLVRSYAPGEVIGTLIDGCHPPNNTLCSIVSYQVLEYYVPGTWCLYIVTWLICRLWADVRCRYIEGRLYVRSAPDHGSNAACSTPPPPPAPRAGWQQRQGLRPGTLCRRRESQARPQRERQQRKQQQKRERYAVHGLRYVYTNM